MNMNGDCSFVSLGSCKVYDRYFVPQCFHCNEFKHFTSTCPNKNIPAKCGKCAGQCKTESCRSKFLKWVNCIKVEKIPLKVMKKRSAIVVY